MAVELGTVSVRLTADASDFTKGTNKAQAALKKLDKAFLGSMAAIGAAAAAVGGVALNAFAGFEQGIANAGAKTMATAEQMGMLSDRAKEMGASTVFSARQSADGLNILAQAGLTVSEQIGAIKPVIDLAVAGTMDLAQATEIAMGAMKGFGLEIDDLNSINDVLANGANNAKQSMTELGEALSFAAPVAAGMGVSIEETTAAISVLANANIKASRGGTAINGILARMEKVSKKLGAGVSAATIRTDGFALSLQKLVNSGLGAGNALELFGLRAGPAVQSLLAQGIGTLVDMEETMSKVGTAAELSDRQLNTFQGTLTLLESAVEGLAIELGEEMAPAFRVIANEVKNFTSDLIKDEGALKNFGNTFMTVVTNVGDALRGFAPIISVVATLIGALAEGFKLIQITANTLAIGLGAVWLAFVMLHDAMVGTIETEKNVLSLMERLNSMIEDTEKTAQGFGDTLVDGTKAGDKFAAGLDRVGAAAQNMNEKLAEAERIAKLTDEFNRNLEATKKLVNQGTGLAALTKEINAVRQGMVASITPAVDLGDSLDKIGKKAETAAEKLARLQRFFKGFTGSFGGDLTLTERKQQMMAERKDEFAAADQRVANFNEGRARSASLGSSMAAVESDMLAAKFEKFSETMEKTNSVTNGLNTAFTDLTGGIGGLTSMALSMFTESEGFQKMLSGVTDVLQKIFDMGIGEILLDVADLLQPILDLLDALAPALGLMMKAMAPLFLVIRPIARVLEVVVGWFTKLVRGMKGFINGIRVFIANIGRRKKNKAYVDDEGNIVDPTGRLKGSRRIINTNATSTGGSVIEWLQQKMDEQSGSGGNNDPGPSQRARERRRNEADLNRSLERSRELRERAIATMRNEEIQRRLTLQSLIDFADKLRISAVELVGFGNWLDAWLMRANANADALGFTFKDGRMQRNELETVSSLLGLDDLSGAIGAAREAFGGVADAANDVTEAMLNVPEVFDAELARFQAASGARGGIVSMTPVNQGGPGGRTWIIENLNLDASDPDALARRLEELATRRTGSPVFIPGRNINPSDIGRL